MGSNKYLLLAMLMKQKKKFLHSKLVKKSVCHTKWVTKLLEERSHGWSPFFKTHILQETSQKIVYFHERPVFSKIQKLVYFTGNPPLFRK